jgi:hypothetical protein
MCIRCCAREASWPDEMCGLCSFYTRIEVARGLRRLGEYLAAWAAFEDWQSAAVEPRPPTLVAWRPR